MLKEKEEDLRKQKQADLENKRIKDAARRQKCLEDAEKRRQEEIQEVKDREAKFKANWGPELYPSFAETYLEKLRMCFVDIALARKLDSGDNVGKCKVICKPFVGCIKSVKKQFNSTESDDDLGRVGMLIEKHLEVRLIRKS